MKRILAILGITVLAAFAAAAQSFAQAPAAAAGTPETLPSVDRILDKYLQAIGGQEAVKKHSSRVSKGQLEIPALGMSGTLEAYEKAPNKSLAIVTIDGFGVIQEGFNGTVGWSRDPMTGLREKTGNELAYIKVSSEFHRDLKLKELYPKIVLKGKEKVGDKEAYVLVATPGEGKPETWYFDVATGLLLRSDIELESPQGTLPTEIYMEEYKDADGIKLPFVLRQVNPMFSFTVKVQQIEHNVAIDDVKFNKPSAQ